MCDNILMITFLTIVSIIVIYSIFVLIKYKKKHYNVKLYPFEFKLPTEKEICEELDRL